MNLPVQMLPGGSSSAQLPDSKVHGANMGSIWGQQDPGGPHVGPMNLAIREIAFKEGLLLH